MAEIAAIFDKLRASEMNAWVGGADPELVGEICCEHLFATVPFAEDAKVLDFGCGVGRILLSLLRRRPDQAVVGVDIMAPAIAFCRREIASVFPNASFELIAEANAHYDDRTENLAGKTREALLADHAVSFDLAYAISVFTHVDPDDLADILGFVGALLKPGGAAYVTAFVLTPHVRAQIAAGACEIAFPAPEYESSDQVFIGNTVDRLAFIAFDARLIHEAAMAAGLYISLIEGGSWSGLGPAGSYQDVVVLRKPLGLSGAGR